MKRLTATFKDDAVIDFQSIISSALDFKIETVEDRAASKRTKVKIAGTTTVDTVMEHYTPSGLFTIAQVQDWVKAKGYAVNSAWGALNLLLSHGYVEKLNKTRYKFLKPKDPAVRLASNRK